VWQDFLDWVLSHVFSPIPEAQALGRKIADQVIAGFAERRGVLSNMLQGELNAAIGGMGSLGMNVTAYAPVAATAPVVAGSTTTVTIGPNYISDGMDMAVFEARVRQVVSEAL
jgi:hypothetical protein